MSRKEQEPWPYGQPTRTCDRCNGTGLSARAAAVYAASRVDKADDNNRLLDVRCIECSGRGQVIDGFSRETQDRPLHRV